MVAHDTSVVHDRIFGAFVIPLLFMTAQATPYNDQEVRGVTTLAEGAFANVDASAFEAAREELSSTTTCMSEPIQASTAARVFLVRGLAAHLDRKPASIASNLAAFAELEALPPPTSVAPEGHPIRQAWEDARETGPSPRRLLPVPAGGRLWIDGAETLELPEER